MKNEIFFNYSTQQSFAFNSLVTTYSLNYLIFPTDIESENLFFHKTVHVCHWNSFYNLCVIHGLTLYTNEIVHIIVLIKGIYHICGSERVKIYSCTIVNLNQRKRMVKKGL